MNLLSTWRKKLGWWKLYWSIQWHKLINENSSLKKVPVMLVATFKDVRDRYISKFPQNFPENWKFHKPVDTNNNNQTPSSSSNNNKPSKSVWSSMQLMQKNIDNIKTRKNSNAVKPQQGPTPLLLLNADILKLVFWYLDIQSLVRCEQVCKKWKEAIFSMHKGNVFELFRCPCIPTIYVSKLKRSINL